MKTDNELCKCLTEAAHRIKEEDTSVFKIAIVANGYLAGILNKLLTRVMGVSKNRITQLGYVATDFQNLTNLARKRDIVIAPFGIAANRPCTFYPPEKVVEVVILIVTGDEVRIRRYQNEGEPFELNIDS
jgi:hypothetical protein